MAERRERLAQQAMDRLDEKMDKFGALNEEMKVQDLMQMRDQFLPSWWEEGAKAAFLKGSKFALKESDPCRCLACSFLTHTRNIL